MRVRNYLQIDCDVEIKTCYIYENSTTKHKSPEKSLTSNYKTKGSSYPSHVDSEVVEDGQVIEPTTPKLTPIL